MKSKTIIKTINQQQVHETIKIDDNYEFNYYMVVFDNSKIHLDVLGHCNSSNITINILLISKNSWWIIWNFNNQIIWNNNNLNIKIIWLIGDWGKIIADWNIEIQKNCQNINCNLNEESIFLSTNWECKFTPQLIIKANNVKAWHWSKIHRLAQNKINYMNAKWLTSNTIKQLLIESYINILMPKDYDKTQILKYLL